MRWQWGWLTGHCRHKFPLGKELRFAFGFAAAGCDCRCGGLTAEPPESGKAECNHGQTGQLGRFKTESQRAVIAAQIFEKEAGDGIEDGVQGKNLSFGVRQITGNQQQNENDDI